MAVELIHLTYVCLAICSLSGSVLSHVKECKKIDSCRCSTDEGEIDLRKLAGTDGKPSFPQIPSNNANFSFSWNPCDSYSLSGTKCTDVAACFEETGRNISAYYGVAKQDTAECVLGQDGECALQYKGKAFNRTSVFSVALRCDKTVEGQVNPVTATISNNTYETVLHSKYACHSSGLSAGAVAVIVAVAIVVSLIAAFAVFIGYLRSKLPDGAPKPTMCTTIKFACGMIFAKCCPCFKRSQYANVP